jgi:hypothetical protein
LSPDLLQNRVHFTLYGNRVQDSVPIQFVENLSSIGRIKNIPGFVDAELAQNDSQLLL